MFYLEDEYTDFIVGDPIREDALYIMADEDKEKANGKDPAGEKSPKEEGTEEAVEETLADAKEEEMEAEEAVEEEAVTEKPEETPAEKEEAIPESPDPCDWLS